MAMAVLNRWKQDDNGDDNDVDDNCDDDCDVDDNYDDTEIINNYN